MSVQHEPTAPAELVISECCWKRWNQRKLVAWTPLLSPSKCCGYKAQSLQQIIMLGNFDDFFLFYLYTTVNTTVVSTTFSSVRLITPLSSIKSEDIHSDITYIGVHNVPDSPICIHTNFLISGHFFWALVFVIICTAFKAYRFLSTWKYWHLHQMISLLVGWELAMNAFMSGCMLTLANP